MGLLSICETKRRRSKSNTEDVEHRKQATIFYSVPSGSGETIQVCKKTFMEIHGITKRRVETLVKAKKRGDIVYTERRGNKKQHRKYTEDDENRIVNHINSFPKEESHYTRAKNSKEYLSQDLNYHKLYQAFMEIYSNCSVTYRFYTDTVKKYFPKLRFQRPRKDTCGTCDLLHSKVQNDPGPNKSKYKKELELHHRKAEKARNEMKKDHENSQKPNSDTCTISIDLQQVFSIPTFTHSQMYYLRQLSCYNLAVTMGDNNQSFMFVWHEGISGRGANEIASCLLKAITNKITHKKKLIVWSDNCGGQNKNQMLLFLWSYLICRGIFDEIEHKYLVPGHSYLSCDRDFALIEKKKRVNKCEVPLDIVRLLVSASHKKQFFATLMDEDDFFDFKESSTNCLNTKKLEISKVKWLKVTKADPGVVYVKKSWTDIEPWVKIKVFKKGVDEEQVLQNLQKLKTKNRLSQEKKADIVKMIPYLKEENKDFYGNLVA